jgi:hypothetical protein
MLPTAAHLPVVPVSSSYRLSESVFWCERNSQVILLDLRTDRYLALDSRASSVFPHLLQSNGQRATYEAVPNTQMNELAELLLQSGLLTTEPGCGKEGTPLAFPAPSSELTPDAFDGRPRLRARDVTAFWVAIGRIGLHLRLLPFSHVVTAARMRRAQRVPSAHRGGRRCDLAMHVAVFDRLRPLAFTARDACLFESLAMIEFLASFRVEASWVFGVQTSPFCAHCWVQLGDTVINDTVEHVRGFTPIMVV